MFKWMKKAREDDRKRGLEEYDRFEIECSKILNIFMSHSNILKEDAPVLLIQLLVKQSLDYKLTIPEVIQSFEEELSDAVTFENWFKYDLVQCAEKFKREPDFVIHIKKLEDKMKKQKENNNE